MPFKVVQTLEGKKYKLFTVPSGWESENILRYPNKLISKYIMDEYSTPTLNWDKMNCKVKRSNILTYESGEQLVSEMLKHSDTEDDVDNFTQQRRPQNKKTLNLNSMAQDMMVNVGSSDIEPASSMADLPVELSNDVTPIVQDAVIFDIDKIFQNQKEILENQGTIVAQTLQNQQQLLDMNTAIVAQMHSLNKVQNILIQKMSAFSVQLEDAVSQIMSPSSPHVQPLQSSKDDYNNNPMLVKPVDSARELDQLEKHLSDPIYRGNLEKTYSIICSGGKGLDCAYSLIDVMFTRKFISECSWTGGSRGEEIKIPLKSYKHVLSFFWNMVHFWDNTFSLQNNEMFFKTILKNSKKRKMSKHERSSTSRQRSNSKNNMKRKKILERDLTYDNDENEGRINEEEITEIFDLDKEHTIANEERNYLEEENTDNNKRIHNSVEEITEENKEEEVIKDIANSSINIRKETSV